MSSFLFRISKNSLWVIIFIGLHACKQQTAFDQLVSENKDFDVLISNGSIVDGSGNPPFSADVLIRADSIAFIGDVDSTQINAVRSINATGKVVSPGFIDAHAHGDPLRGGDFSNFISMGVTTIVLGQDGSHPIIVGNPDFDLTDWMDSLERLKPQLNVAMMAGHATLRYEAGVLYDEDPTQEQLYDMLDQLQAYFEAGVYGLSTGLEYVEAMNAKEDELIAMAKKVGENDGIMISHMRNEDDDQIEKSLNELLALGNYCKVQATHMKVVYGKGRERAMELIQMMDDARNAGVVASADVYPYLASYTTIGIVFPEWAKTQEKFEIAKSERKTELEDYLFNRVNQRNGQEATLLARNKYAGKTLAQAAESEGVSFVELLMQIGPRGGSGAYFIMEDSLMSTLLINSNTMISSDGSPTMRHPRGYGAFARVIERYVIDRKQLSIEEAVRKMTGLPAQTFVIENRGLLKQGYKADILVFNPEEIKENATYIDPFKKATGFDYVFINGKLVLKNGDQISSTSGQLLRK